MVVIVIVRARMWCLEVLVKSCDYNTWGYESLVWCGLWSSGW